MTDNILWELYELWTNSENYFKDSPLENEEYEEHVKKVTDVVGEKTYNKITDDILTLAGSAEMTGFNNGFRYGVMFMSGILKGSAVYNQCDAKQVLNI